LNAPFDFSNVVDVAVHSAAIFRTERSLERVHLTRDEVENAATVHPACRTLIGSAAESEQLLEGDAWVANDWERFRRRPPTDRVGVDARISVRASAGLIDVLDAELHRRDR